MKKGILLNIIVILAITAVVKAEMIYFTDRDTDSIYRANSDGTGVEKIVSTPNPAGIALDVAAGKMYWTSYITNTNCTIRRANLDGTNPEVVITRAYGVPNGIALDVAGEKIYWVENGIRRANVDGSGDEYIISSSARDVALDLPAGKIYWTNVTNAYGGVGTRTIERANLDGTDIEIVVDQLGTPDGIAIDKASGKMYWTDQSTDKIQRANLDGTEIEDLVTATVDRPFGIALDIPNGKMYWTDWQTDKIQRANLDGSDLEDLITTGLSMPLFIAIDVEPEPVTLLGIEIVGPEEVPENFGADYKALALYSTGSTKDITTSTIWSVEPGTYASIDADGLLLTGDINSPQDITIYAQCTLDEGVFEANMPVQITLAHTFHVPADCNTIQAAIDDSNDGDVVIVAPGTYTGNGNRELDFRGKAITVRSTDPQDPNIVAATIIDCENETCGFDFHNSENSYSVINGFTITRGYHTDSGGGIRCYKSHPKILNCVITESSAQYCGGGMFNNYSDPILINCTFTGNSAPDRGGAIWCHSGSDPYLLNCSFIENSAGDGGAISGGGSPTIINCDFYKNSALGDIYDPMSSGGYGGAVHSVDNRPKLENCSFTENSAGFGGAIYNAAGTGNTNASPIVNKCIFTGNTATEKGGAVSNTSGTGESRANPVISSCLFVDNHAASHGGAMYNSSSTGSAKTQPEIINCTFSGNSAANGSVMYNREGISSSDTTVTVKSSIFWDNDGSDIFVESGSTFVDYSCVQDGFSGTGNINTDPCFVYPDSNDFHLLPNSPCINAGDPNYIPEPNETDLDGNPRIDSGRIDMGAYESVYKQARLWISPQVINRRNPSPRMITAWMYLPAGINKEQVDEDAPLVLYPGGIKAKRQFVFQNRGWFDKRTRVLALFDRDEFLDAVDTTGTVKLTVIGNLLISGQYFFGSDYIKIISPKPNPPHWH
jgi:predicted outer membrane repeat protein